MKLHKTKQEWKKLKEELMKTEYHEFNPMCEIFINDSEDNLTDDQRLSLRVGLTNTNGCPIERLNPDILNMIIELEERIVELEYEKERNRMEKIKKVYEEEDGGMI